MQRLSFRCRIVYSAMNQVFTAELCCLHQMSFRRRIVSAANQFRCRIVFSAVNEFSLPSCVSVVNQFRCWIVLSVATEFLLPNCVFRRESGVRCRIVLSATNQVFAAKFVWCTENQVFIAKICCPQWIRCSLPNCVVRSVSGFRCQIMLSASIQVFAAEFVWSAANQVFAAELCCSQWIWCSLPNCVVCSELSFRCRICVVCSELGVRCLIVLSTAN